ncbi:3-hydroxyacyl-CoA dehydrogenase [Kocuria marina]|uniref:3-hydroxyacyl-CoA dehydrogenase n=1 Tax=Kocuria marina TaxID=223184 RepID=UPI0022DFF7C8|nr:3-hydroxyacyl-CoA dehydrogenase [Kocuria marina]
MSETSPERIAIIGGGSIGVAFAVVFARAGHRTIITDPDPQRRAAVPSELAARLTSLDAAGLLTEDPEAVLARATVTSTVAEAVDGATLVQECAPERLEIKQEVFRELGELTGPDTILASSSSAITASRTADGLECADRILVAHPGNPPYLLPVIELVPTADTRPEIVEAAHRIYAAAGMSPVTVAREVEGFIFNRLQGAVLREAYALVRDGVATVEDIDTVVRDGLGRRWSFMGPFETVDLNTRGGISSHAQKMGPAYERMGAERGQHDPWTPDLVAEVNHQRRALLPLDQWEDRVAWRDQRLIELAQTLTRTAPSISRKSEHDNDN